MEKGVVKYQGNEDQVKQGEKAAPSGKGYSKHSEPFLTLMQFFFYVLIHFCYSLQHHDCMQGHF